MFSGIRPQLVVVIVLSGSLFVGCGSGAGGGSGGSSSPPGLASIEVKPNSTTLAVGDSGKQFSAEPKDAAGNTINGEEIFWEIANNDGQKGVVNATGWYRPPTVLPDSSNVVLVKAFSRKDPNKSGFASVTLLTGDQLSFGGDARVAVHTTGDDSYAFGQQNIAVLDKTVYMVWADNTGSLSGYDIYFVKSPDRGRTLECSKQFVLDRDQLSPSIAVDLQGNVYIVWYDNTIGSNYDIFFIKGMPGTDGCINFLSERVVNINPDQSIEHRFPSIMVGPDDNVYVAWSWGSGTSSGVYFAKGTLANQTGEIVFENQVLVKEDFTGAVYGDPSISVALNGQVYIVYSGAGADGFHIYLSRSLNGGINFEEKKVTDQQAVAFYPAMAVDLAGNVYIAWQDFRNAVPKIYMAKSTDGGQNFGPNTSVLNADGDQYSPSLSVDSGGNLYLAWEDDRNVLRDLVGNPLDDNSDIYFAKSIDGGATFSEHKRVNNAIGTEAQYSPRMALDSAGRAFILWFDERNTCSSSCPYALYLAMGQ